MPIVKTDVVVTPLSPLQWFLVLDDVESFPKLMKQCQSVTTSRTQGKTKAHITAKIASISGSVDFEQSYEYDKLTKSYIIRTSSSGPFTHCRGRWDVKPAASGSEVSFEIDFQFNNSFYGFFGNSIIGRWRSKIIPFFLEHGKKQFYAS